MRSSDDDEDAAVPSRSGPVPLVWQQLQGLGFQRVTGNYGASQGACAASALSTGFLLFPADASALDAPARRYDGKPLEAFGGEFTENECPHRWTPTLRQLLSQPDYAGTDYESGLSKATVLCPEAGCLGRCYMTFLCAGRPHCDSGKGHNHCTECPATGKCIGDYREQHCDDCGDHFFGGFSVSFRCRCKGGGEERGEGEDEEGGDDAAFMHLLESLMPRAARRGGGAGASAEASAGASAGAGGGPAGGASQGGGAGESAAAAPRQRRLDELWGLGGGRGGGAGVGGGGSSSSSSSSALDATGSSAAGGGGRSVKKPRK